MTVELAERLHGEGCGCTRCTSFQPGNEWAVKHGAFSDRQIRPLAANHRRRVLRQMRLRAGDLDPVGRAYLEHYCRLSAKVVLIDDYLDEVGILDEDGNPRPSMPLYVRLHNAAVQALGKLEHHLNRDSGRDLESALRALREGMS